MTAGGEGGLHSELSKQRMREATKTEKHRKALSIALKGNKNGVGPKSEETKKKVRDSLTGKSYEEQAGSEKAEQRKQKIRESWIHRRLKKVQNAS